MFTLPALVAEIAFHNKAVVYAILFRAAAEALRRVAADPRHLGAEIGAVAVLHTWGQALHHHPHLHCIVPGGGISPDQTRWVACKPGFFLPVRVLSRCFRDLFLDQLRAAFANGELRCSGALAGWADPGAFAARLDAAAQTDWVVFAKPPFAGPRQVLGYLGRYTHRVAIANSRLVRLDDGQVNFTWKDYRQDGRPKVMTLPADEFIRRFLQHTVPGGFHRIRHFGFLASRHRTAKLALCRDLLAAPPPPDPEPPRRWQDRLRDLTGHDVEACPGCGGGCCPAACCGLVRRPARRCGATAHDPALVAIRPPCPARQRPPRRRPASAAHGIRRRCQVRCSRKQRHMSHHSSANASEHSPVPSGPEPARARRTSSQRFRSEGCAIQSP